MFYGYGINPCLVIDAPVLGGPFDLVSRVSKVGYGGFKYGFYGILSRLTKSKGPPSSLGLKLLGFRGGALNLRP